MRNDILVYVCGPYSHGDQVVNVQRAIETAEALRSAGYTPVVPHLTMLWHLYAPKEPAYWYAYTMDLLRGCDVLIRHDNVTPSKGSDAEVQEALACGIPVVATLPELEARFP